MLKEKIYLGIPVHSESVRTLEMHVNSLRNLRGLDFTCFYLVNGGTRANNLTKQNNEIAQEYLRGLNCPNFIVDELVTDVCNIGMARNTILNMVKSYSNLEKSDQKEHFVTVDADTQFSENYAKMFCQMRADFPNAKLVRPGIEYNGFEDLSTFEICSTCISLIDYILKIKDQTESYKKGMITSSGSHSIFDLNSLKELEYKPIEGGEDTDFSKRVCQSLPFESCIKYPNLKLYTSFRLSTRTIQGFGNFPKSNEYESESSYLQQFRFKMSELIIELYKYSDKYTAYAFTDSNEFRCLIDACIFLGLDKYFDFQKVVEELKFSFDQYNL